MYASRGDEHVAARKEWFFRRLLSSDVRQRAASIQKIRVELLEMEPHVLDVHVPSLRRLARDAPLPDVRAGCLDILDELNTPHDAHDDTPVSYYMDAREIVDVTATHDPDVAAIFVKCFLQSGRVSHLTRMLAWHTPYLKVHHTCIRDRGPTLSYSPILSLYGPLPLEWRNYIALMAASEYRCHYVSILHQHYFLINGGDATWLDGLDYVPSKLARLHSLNALLAHQPWLVTSDDVASLLQTTTDRDGGSSSSWSVSELVHAIIVMCMFHSMSSIALGLGCVDEADLTLLSSSAMFVPTMRSRRKSSNLSDRRSDAHHRSRGDSMETVVPLKGDMWRYCSETIDEYVDFDVRSAEYNVLHTEDFSWDEHCFSLVTDKDAAAANQEDDDEKKSEVDTTPFRHAIWYYVHRIYGICHDDYDYRNVNIYLNRPTKHFVKKVACTPWRVTVKDFEHFSHTLTASEKCHVTLLAAEARKQAGLMYGLRAVMQHFL
ncbi:hypothetical protein DYB34_000836 [Aphanomyces astaci]|uniref:Sestrin n=2 Tax=Aphanomyces astaci TaxID=112090 RepID=A0A3R6YL20_APHAT|nr:hypothetical protein DYB34_000836 [Aphanomyces astaci]